MDGKCLNNTSMSFYSGNNIEAYLSIMETYKKKGLEKLNMIKHLYSDHDWKNYIIEVHALKSTSLTIGAKELSEKAKTMELSGKAGDYRVIFENHEATMELYEKILDICGEILALNGIVDAEEGTNVQDTAELKEISKEELLKAVQRIQEAAEVFDSDIIESVVNEMQYTAINGKTLTEGWQKILELANDFEYDEVVKAAWSMTEQL